MPGIGLAHTLLCALLVVPVALATHACEAEVSSACPERPGSEIASCLKDKSEHDRPTVISSDCTDFIALNVACKDDIAKFCDDNHFSDDTILCLMEWTDQRDLTTKCSGVMKWAIPEKVGEAKKAVTDELGLSDKDYAEKREWQAKRKAEREAAIGRMKDAKADEEEVKEMEDLKKENPAEYKQRLQERSEAKKSLEEQRKRQRLKVAADERKRRKEAGLPEEEDPTEQRKHKRRPAKAEKESWLPTILVGLFSAFVLAALVNVVFNKEKEA